MNKLVLLRHGQSQWNLENKFTDGKMCLLQSKELMKLEMQEN